MTPGRAVDALGAGCVPGDDDRDLLRPDADLHVVAVGRAPGAAGRATLRPCTSTTASVAGSSGDPAGDQVGLAEEVGDERGHRVLVEVGRGAHLLDPAVVHDRDGVGHGHGLFLVVRHVDERDADLGLDALELELHLPAQLEVERAERLVEQQHARAG